MSASTRQQILDTAERLFSEQGYHNVSMRAISSALGISVGNLTYYFPRKADLANALLEAELGQIAIPVRPGLDALDDYLRRMLSSLQEHARLFSDPMVFLSIPELADGHRTRIRRLRSNLLAMLQAQLEAGLMAAPFGASYDRLTDLLMYSHLGWQQQLALFSVQPVAALEYAMQLQWEALRPWLTDAGLIQLKQLSYGLCTDNVVFCEGKNEME